MRANGRKGRSLSGRKKLRPCYRGREELPTHCIKFAEGEGRYYGSGRAVFDIMEGAIELRLYVRTAGHRYQWETPISKRREAAVALKRVSDEVGQARASSPVQADKGAYPCILEHLTETKYPDGTERQTSSLVVVADTQSWRVCLSDRDNSRVMWKTGNTLQEALDAIELGLMGDDPSDWRKAATTAAKRKK